MEDPIGVSLPIAPLSGEERPPQGDVVLRPQTPVNGRREDNGSSGVDKLGQGQRLQ